jgi:hypothetical protein
VRQRLSQQREADATRITCWQEVFVTPLTVQTHRLALGEHSGRCAPRRTDTPLCRMTRSPPHRIDAGLALVLVLVLVLVLRPSRHDCISASHRRRRRWYYLDFTWSHRCAECAKNVVSRSIRGRCRDPSASASRAEGRGSEMSTRTCAGDRIEFVILVKAPFVNHHRRLVIQVNHVVQHCLVRVGGRGRRVLW